MAKQVDSVRRMIDLFKKGILAGIGATVVTKETLENTLNELVKKGKLSADEAKETADKIVDRSRAEYEKVRGEMSTLLEEMLRKGSVVPRSDFDALQTRVEALEKAMAECSGGESKGKSK